MKSLFKELKKYSQQDYYPFHMPGGKRNPKLDATGLPYGYDITEIDGFDNLHHPLGLIRELEKRASKLFNSEETAISINGSTAGILSGIMGSTNKGDKVLVGRNSHKSVYHGIVLNELIPVYLYPDYDQKMDVFFGVSPLEVEKLLDENPDIKAVIITSPTYEGVISGVKEIAIAVHKRGIPLIVDEAHGAHLGFGEGPSNSNLLGADIVIHSIHKTLPALTQTALVHKNGTLVDWQKVKFYLQVFQSTSPSYILMSSIDVCISMLEEESIEGEFYEYYKLLIETRRRLGKLLHLKLFKPRHYEYDISKILISTKGTNYTGLELYNELLNKYNLQMEMAAGSHVLAMTSIADTKDGFNRLVEALEEIDERIERGHIDQTGWQFPKMEQVYKPSKGLTNANVVRKGSRFVKIRDSENCISKEFVYLYPPGSPLIVPGERINKRAVEILEQYSKLKYEIKGNNKPGEIEVLVDG